MATASNTGSRSPSDAWPELPFEGWQNTYATLHRYLQIVGKVRLALAPKMNHWWQVAMYVTSRGLTTSPIPYAHGVFEVDFDFINHELRILTSDDHVRVRMLEARPVAEFYRDIMSTLRSLGVDVSIWDVPVEIPDDRTHFSKDYQHDSYDADAVNRCWRILVQADTAMKAFRARFTGKCSPVHFFWGSFDLAVTRFSGRPAPERQGADVITREAYCEEVSSAGFWPGSAQTGGPIFYSYAAPEPKGFAAARARPGAARYDTDLKEFILPYDAVRTADDPQRLLLDFFQSTYEATANLGQWDRKVLERPLITGERPGAEAEHSPAK
ncbi:DUF5996 family protein [Myxococcaceae bacterium GXIMD 01537]